jgi:hypothetical protein
VVPLNVGKQRGTPLGRGQPKGPSGHVGGAGRQFGHRVLGERVQWRAAGKPRLAGFSVAHVELAAEFSSQRIEQLR